MDKERETALLQKYRAIVMYGIGRSRTCVAILKKAHLCEVIVTYRPMILKTLSPERKIFVSE